MKLESLLQNIAERWRGEFITFVQTGDASSGFMEYLDQDTGAQAAVEQAFTDQSRALEGLAELVRTSDLSAGKASSAEGASMARSVERIAELPESEFAEAVTIAAKALALHAAAKPEKADALKSTLSALQTKVGSLVR